jgi:hypothetical protein
MSIRSDGNVGIGITNPDSKIHIPTINISGVTTNLLNFKNTSGYGIYATSIPIAARGNTLNFFSNDFNSGGTITIRNILLLHP